MKGFKRAAIACVHNYLAQHGVRGRLAYKVERIKLIKKFEDTGRQVRWAPTPCILCSSGGPVGVGDIVVHTRRAGSSYAGHSWSCLHEDCLKKWADENPITNESQLGSSYPILYR